MLLAIDPPMLQYLMEKLNTTPIAGVEAARFANLQEVLRRPLDPGKLREQWIAEYERSKAAPAAPTGVPEGGEAKP